MPAATFSCPKCNAVLGIDPGLTEATVTCPHCAALVEAYFFPGFFRPLQIGAVASALVDHTEASCFNHPQKQAIHVCDGCGRMICALCSIDLNDEHLCPNCISSGKKKGKITTLEDTRTRYDTIAIALAISGTLCYPFAIFLLPAAIFVAIRHWNSRGSLLGVSKTRFVAAIIVAIGALLFYGAILILAFHHPK